MSQLLLVRHCTSSGQAPDAPLTAEGLAQARALATFLAGHPVDLVVSSPYRRARETAAPFAAAAGVPVEIEPRLAERRLSGEPLDDWLDVIRASFDDHDLAAPGGESAREVIHRASAALEEIARRPLIVSHGNLLSLFLHSIDPRFGFAGWKSLSNPDVFCAEWTGSRFSGFERLWPDAHAPSPDAPA